MSMLSRVQLRLHTMRERPLQKMASIRLFIPRGGSHRRGTECTMKGLLDCVMDGNFSAAMGAAWAAEGTFSSPDMAFPMEAATARF